MSISRLPFVLEDLRSEVQEISGNDDADITITLDADTFKSVIGELTHQCGGLFTVVMNPGCPPEHRYKGISIIKRADDAASASA